MRRCGAWRRRGSATCAGEADTKGALSRLTRLHMAPLAGSAARAAPARPRRPHAQLVSRRGAPDRRPAGAGRRPARPAWVHPRGSKAGTGAARLGHVLGPVRGQAGGGWPAQRWHAVRRGGERGRAVRCAQEGCARGRQRGRGEAEGRRRRRAAVREHADDGGVLPPPAGGVNVRGVVVNGVPTASQTRSESAVGVACRVQSASASRSETLGVPSVGPRAMHVRHVCVRLAFVST